MTQLGRNDVCFCGSGKKYKKCCLKKEKDIATAGVDADFFKSVIKKYPGVVLNPVAHQEMYASKLSAVILEFVKELLDKAKDFNQQKSAIGIGIMVWNLSSLSQDERVEFMLDVFKDPVYADRQDRETLSEIVLWLLQKKEEMFSDDRRRILDFEIKQTCECGLHLNVVTALPQ